MTPARSLLSCSSLHTASRTWRGLMCDFLLSRSALQASSRISEAGSRVPAHRHHDVPATALFLHTTF